MVEINRRRFLNACAHAALSYTFLSKTALAAPEDDWALSDDFLEALFLSDAEPTFQRSTFDLTRTEFRAYLNDLKNGQFRIRSWFDAADRDDNPDTQFLDEPFSDTPFDLSADHLERLAEKNGFDARFAAPKHEGFSSRILFGLRGCRTTGDASSLCDRVTLVETVPNFLDRSCVLGVWDRAAGKVAAFEGSTVPNAIYLFAQARNEEGANLLPTGVHQYKVGLHGRSFSSVSAKQPGAFIQQKAAPVRREKAFTTLDDGTAEFRISVHTHWFAAPLDFNGNPMPVADNIHAAVLNERTSPVYYSSAGCQVVDGAYYPAARRSVGAWDAFRLAAGLAAIDNDSFEAATADDGKSFFYMLLTGREARLAAAQPQSLPKTLRYGSYGDSVESLQRALGVGVDGDLGYGTAWKIIEKQTMSEDGVSVDGIVSPKNAGLFGVSL